MPQCFIRLCLFVALAFSASLTSAKTLQVGITEVPPFVMQTERGEWEGIGQKPQPVRPDQSADQEIAKNRADPALQ